MGPSFGFATLVIPLALTGIGLFLQHAYKNLSMRRLWEMELERSVGDPDKAYHLRTISVAIDLQVTDPPVETDQELDLDSVSDFIKQHCAMQFVTEGQAIAFSFSGLSLRAEIQSVARTHGEARSGIISGETVWCVVPKLGSRVKFTTSSSSSLKAATVPLFRTSFDFEKLGVGGLDAQFSEIFRRAFASRIIPADIVTNLGIQHVKGIMLHGAPGCGKTLLARRICRLLNAAEVTVVNGPEVMSKYVGESAENVRKLFANAETEFRQRGARSRLHILVFDEIDAICRQRGASHDTPAGDQVVNQLLSKMDGVEALDNLLIMGLTNHLELLDDALLRPGRFELKVEIGLPDEIGRLQILRIHTVRMREMDMLAPDVDLTTLATNTKNYSGAELAGVVRSASSYAMLRKVDTADWNRVTDEPVVVTALDVDRALTDIRPKFGVDEEEFARCHPYGLIHYGPVFTKLYETACEYVTEMRESELSPLLSVLLVGPSGAGKTALAAELALQSGFPFVKMLSPETLLGLDEQGKCRHISTIFENAYRSTHSVIVVDDLEGLIEYVDNGPRFSNAIRQTLSVLLKRHPPLGRKILLLGTMSQHAAMTEQKLGLPDCFDYTLHVPLLSDRDSLASVMEQSTKVCGSPDSVLSSADRILAAEPRGISIRQILKTIDLMARQTTNVQDALVASKVIASKAD